MRTRPIILGAGLSGLGAASVLPDAVLYEANDTPSRFGVSP